MSARNRLDQIEQTALRVFPLDVGLWGLQAANPGAADMLLVAPADLAWMLAKIRETEPEPEPQRVEAPHSRACGIREHSHGLACHPNCPTCGGRPWP